MDAKSSEGRQVMPNYFAPHLLSTAAMIYSVLPSVVVICDYRRLLVRSRGEGITSYGEFYYLIFMLEIGSLGVPHLDCGTLSLLAFLLL